MDSNLKPFDKEPSFYQSACKFPYVLQCLFKRLTLGDLLPECLSKEDRYYHYVRATTLAESISTTLLGNDYQMDHNGESPLLSRLYLTDLSRVPLHLALVAWLDQDGFKWDEWEGIEVASDLSYGLVNDSQYKKSVIAYATFIAAYGPVFLPMEKEYHIMQQACADTAIELYHSLDDDLISKCESLAKVKSRQALAST